MKIITTSKLSTEACTPWRMESAPERRANGALFQIFDGCGKRTGAQHQRQIVRGFLAEIAFDHALNHRCGS